MIRFAAGISADPAGAVRRWRMLSGGKAVGCVSPFPIPEILHAAGLLPVELEPGVLPDVLFDALDAFVAPVGTHFGPETDSRRKPRFVSPGNWAYGIEGVLDLLEGLAEWAGSVSGEAVTEGAMQRSVAAYRERDAGIGRLMERCSRGSPFLSPQELSDVLRAGRYLPPGTYSRLLFLILAEEPPPSIPGRGDPLLELARRIADRFAAEKE